jgi:uncharacterized protein with ATP-grasp and redox domains
MDLSILYNKQFIVLFFVNKFVQVEKDVPANLIVGPVSFIDMLEAIEDISNKITRIHIYEVDELNKSTKILSDDTIHYLLDKTKEIIADHMLLNHIDKKYDCSAEIITYDNSIFLEKQDTSAG